MFSDSFFITIFGYTLRTLPTLLVCGIGIFILKTRILPGKAQTYGVSGLALLILVALGGVIFSMYVSYGGVDYASPAFHMVQMAYGAVSQVIHAVALILMVMAICGKESIAKSGETKNPYEQ